MLSICIPIYNFDVRLLVKQLSEQILVLSEKCELILIDDASEMTYKEINEESCQQFKYFKLKTNIGRARIRNLFLKYATFENLLFLDCDSLVVKKDFIEKYIYQIENTDSQVICGGREYPINPPKDKNKHLRWLYGVKRESQPVHVRQAAPNHSFMTNNFVVKKSILETIRFDERLKDYGHEDTLFGYELMLNKIEIQHIHNPIENGDIETNEIFLQKTEEGIKNLVNILKFKNSQPEFIEMVSLLKMHRKLAFQPIQFMLNLFLPVLINPLKYTLSNCYISLNMFNIYKLSLLTKYLSNK